jgi:hypothetical protein
VCYLIATLNCTFINLCSKLVLWVKIWHCKMEYRDERHHVNKECTLHGSSPSRSWMGRPKLSFYINLSTPLHSRTSHQAKTLERNRKQKKEKSQRIQMPTLLISCSPKP